MSWIWKFPNVCVYRTMIQVTYKCKTSRTNGNLNKQKKYAVQECTLQNNLLPRKRLMTSDLHMKTARNRQTKEYGVLT